MRHASLRPSLKAHPGIFVTGLLFSITFLFTASSITVFGQGNQLSLADILIALRSKKATLPERNQILTDAVAERGTTFSITPEIERELSATGADKALIDSIRKKSQFIKVAAVVSPSTEVKPKPEPAASPPPPDFSFFAKRAGESVSKGDLDAALSDYTKAIQMNGSAINALLGRAAIYSGKNSPELAIADYSKVIELDTRNSLAYAHRGECYEKMEKPDLAITDYKKALELDASNESAKAALTGIEAARAKAAQKLESLTVPAPIVPTVIPEFVDLGQLTESQAIKMVKPIYSPSARNANIGGKVVINVEIDREGNVTSAKVISGHPLLKQNSEAAARNCKFKPAMVGDQAVKAKGTIVYSFVPTR